MARQTNSGSTTNYLNYTKEDFQKDIIEAKNEIAQDREDKQPDGFTETPVYGVGNTFIDEMKTKSATDTSLSNYLIKPQDQNSTSVGKMPADYGDSKYDKNASIPDIENGNLNEVRMQGFSEDIKSTSITVFWVALIALIIGRYVLMALGYSPLTELYNSFNNWAKPIDAEIEKKD